MNIGDIFTRDQLMAIFKISGQSGIMKTNSLNCLVLTTSEENIENFAQIGVDAIEGSINRIITNEEAAQLERENDAKKALEEAEKNYNKAVGLLEAYWAKAAQAGENKEEVNNEKNKQLFK